jgi:endonuclease YncB( thermonuclease family)
MADEIVVRLDRKGEQTGIRLGPIQHPERGQKHAQSSTQTWGQMASRVVGWRAHNIT